MNLLSESRTCVLHCLSAFTFMSFSIFLSLFYMNGMYDVYNIVSRVQIPEHGKGIFFSLGRRRFCFKSLGRFLNFFSHVVSRLWRNWRPRLPARVLLVELGWRRVGARSSHLAMVLWSMWDVSKLKRWHGVKSEGQNPVHWWSTRCLEAAEWWQEINEEVNLYVDLGFGLAQHPSSFERKNLKVYQLFWRTFYACFPLMSM